jgi:hypothetical protein
MTEAFDYALFGLRVHSNFPIPELPVVAASVSDSPQAAPPDFTIHWQQRPKTSGTSISGGDEVEGGDLTYESAYMDEAGAPALKIWAAGKELLRLEYSDGTKFWVARSGKEAWAMWPEPSLTIEDTATYFLGPVLGLVLRLRGVTCLHASAVAIGNKAVAFVGDAGAGKSTTVAALARKGFAVLSDDIVALAERDGDFYVTPAYPYICLWPESVVALYGSAEALPKFAATYEKRCLSLPKEALRFASEPVRLGCVYVMGRRGEEAARAEAVPAREAFVTLVANTYATNMLDSAMRAREFETLGRLMKAVPVKRLTANADSARIDELCEVIAADATGLA